MRRRNPPHFFSQDGSLKRSDCNASFASYSQSNGRSVALPKQVANLRYKSQTAKCLCSVPFSVCRWRLPLTAELDFLLCTGAHG